MLYNALNICVLAKLCSTTLKIPDDDNAEKLRIPKIFDREGIRHYGRRPTPVMLDAQIATIWMGIMGKARKQLLAELKKIILGRKRENWYTIYLTVFIILWNLEYVYEHQKERLDIFCEKVLATPVGRLVNQLRNLGANFTFLAPSTIVPFLWFSDDGRMGDCRRKYFGTFSHGVPRQHSFCHQLVRY